MFEIVRELWPVAVALWLLDGVYLVRAGQRLFVQSPLVGQRRLLPGWRLAALLPGERVYHAQEPAVAPTPTGIHVDLDPPRGGEPAVPAAQSRAFRYEELTAPELEGTKIRWDAATTTTLTSPTAARRLFRAVSRLAHAKPGARKALLSTRINERFDLDEIERALAAARPWTTRLDALATAFAVVLLVGLPLSAYANLGGPRALPALLVALVLLYAALLGVSVVAARRLRPWSERSALQTVAPILLCAPAAIRAPATLTVDLLSRFDPFALAAALLPAERFAPIARAELWALQHPPTTAPGADGLHPDWQEITRERQEAVLALLRRRGLAPETLLAPPQRPTPEAAGFCPICEGSFRTGIDHCPDCRRPLVAYAPRP